MDKNKHNKKQKKLTQAEYRNMWGEDGPYSQVRLCEETRILDDSISRVFLVIEAEINPFTFEYVQKNRKKFSEDEPILQLIDHAENRGKFGYVVSAGEVELEDRVSQAFARKQADMTIQTLIRMHQFVIDEFNLKKENILGGIADEEKPVWNENVGRVELTNEDLWSSETLVGSHSGVKNNKMRFFIVFAFENDFCFKNKSATLFAKTLKIISMCLGVEIEDVGVFHEYVLVTALVPFDVAPAGFIESVLNECIVDKKPVFQKDYFITNVKKPTQEQILTFLKQLPLDRDTRMKFEE